MRSPKGVSMIVCELAILIPILVCATLFLADTGLAMYYRSKFNFVLEQVAQIAIQIPTLDRQKEVAQTTASKMFIALGLNATGLKVDVKETQINGYQALQISGKATFRLLRGMDFLPSIMNMADLTIAIIPANRTEALIAISPYPYALNPEQDQQCIYLPILAPRPDLPVWRFPYDEALNRIHLLDGGVPEARTNAVRWPNIPPSLY